MSEKSDLYEMLKSRGENVPPYSHATLEGLRRMAAEVAERDAEREKAGSVKPSAEPSRPAPPPKLKFDGGGWCEELQTSYFAGTYQPKSWREYDALKRFARGGGK